MEVYEAIADFIPADGAQNQLGFQTGDRFVAVRRGDAGGQWLGARALRDNRVGYIPTSYVQLDPTAVVESDDKIPMSLGLELSEEMQTSQQLQDQMFIPDADYEDIHEERSGEEPDDKYLFFFRFHDIISDIDKIESFYESLPEPDPDYVIENHEVVTAPPDNLTGEGTSNGTVDRTKSHKEPMSCERTNSTEKQSDLPSAESSSSEVIQPKKLPNPCVDSKERQALHRELLMNYRVGRNVLKKPELAKVMQQRKEAQRIKEWDDQKSTKRTSLELKLEQRANRLKEEEEKMKPITEEPEKKPEYLKVHAKITAKTAM